MKAANVLSVARNRGVRATVGAVAWGLRGAAEHRLLGRAHLQRNVLGHPMLLDLGDPGISRTLLLFGTREQEHVEIMRRVLQPGMTVLDIGANIGFYALLELELVGETGDVVLVEPSPQNVELLQRNLGLNSFHDVVVHPVAVSDRSGTRPFTMSTFSNLGTFHDLDAESTAGVLEVETVTVPQLVGDGKLDLIRMDVEGHEVEVLNGMIDEVERGTLRPMVLFETHRPRYTADHDIAPVLCRMLAAGYHAAYIGSSSQRGTAIVESLGYRGEPPIRTDDVERVIFRDIADDHFLELIADRGGVRTVLLAPRA